MVGITTFIYREDYLNYDFGPGHPLKQVRQKYTLDYLRNLGVFGTKAKYFEPQPATESELLLVHSKEYIKFVKKMSEKGFGYLDYGDTPATKGIYDATCSIVGGSISGADMIMSGKSSHAFNPGGGLHHAKKDRAAGFCVFNDIAIAIRHLQKKYGLKKIAIIDIDGHHGDGTQEIFYEEPILKISFHRLNIFPGTGDINELGKGEGKGYSINVPLPEKTSDDAFLYAFKELVPPLIKNYEPEILLNQFGVDGHFQDPLVGLSLTTRTYVEVSTILHDLAHKISNGKYLIFGGGGYSPHNVAKCWTLMFVTVSQALPQASKKKFEAFFDKREPKKNERILKEVKNTVIRVKKSIFPFHDLDK